MSKHTYLHYRTVVLMSTGTISKWWLTWCPLLLPVKDDNWETEKKNPKTHWKGGSIELNDSFHGNPKIFRWTVPAQQMYLHVICCCTCTVHQEHQQSNRWPVNRGSNLWTGIYNNLTFYTCMCGCVCEPDSTWPFDNAHHSWYFIVKELRSQTFNKMIYSSTTHTYRDSWIA